MPSWLGPDCPLRIALGDFHLVGAPEAPVLFQVVNDGVLLWGFGLEAILDHHDTPPVECELPVHPADGPVWFDPDGRTVRVDAASVDISALTSREGVFVDLAAEGWTLAPPVQTGVPGLGSVAGAITSPDGRTFRFHDTEAPPDWLAPDAPIRALVADDVAVIGSVTRLFFVEIGVKAAIVLRAADTESWVEELLDPSEPEAVPGRAPAAPRPRRRHPGLEHGAWFA